MIFELAVPRIATPQKTGAIRTPRPAGKHQTGEPLRPLNVASPRGFSTETSWQSAVVVTPR